MDAASTTISCLLVTLGTPERLAGLRRSIAAFRQQTHADRELVVAVDSDSAEATQAIAKTGGPAVRLVAVPGRPVLGAMRNIALRHARGDVVCQWDDDDLYHPLRLEHQLAAMAASGKPACCLQQVMQFVAPLRLLFCTNWAATPGGAHPGTMMCRRNALPHYPETRLDEDTAVLVQLQHSGALCLLPDRPHLYVYVTHGHNAQAAAHHDMLVRRLSQTRGLLRRREAALRDGLAPLDFGPGTVTVQGSDGPAFVLSPPAPS